jgi:hypothetical protein
MRFTSWLTLLVAVLCTATNFLFAQSTFSNSPSDSIVLNGKFEDVEILSIHQINSTADTIVLKWKKISAMVPNGWDAVVCDNSTCYTSLLDSGIMNPVVAADYGFVILHITPHTNYGTAIVKYAVWDTANPTLKDTLTFILKVEQGLSINKLLDENNIQIYPNPIHDNLKIKTFNTKVNSVKIIALNGKKTEDKNVNINAAENEFILDVSTLMNGIYFLVIQTQNETIIRKIVK